MRVKRTYFILATILGALLAAIIACTLPGNPQPPLPSYVPSTQAAATFEQTIIDSIAQAAPDGTFSTTVTQEQFSSWLQIKAPAYAAIQKQSWPFKDGQAAFKNAKVTIYATLMQAGAPESPVQLVLIPGIATDGEFKITVDSAQMGIFGVPGALLSHITDIIQTSLNGQLGQYKGRYTLTAITVGNGTISVNGKVIRG